MVLKKRSNINRMSPTVIDGNASSSSTIVINDIHVKMGMRMKDMPGARMLRMVTMMLIAPAIEEMPSRCTAKIAMSSPGPIWTESGYGQKLGLPPAAQGTGMSTEEAQALRIKDIPLFQEYTQRVWAGTEELFDAATPALLDKVVMVKPLGEMSVIQCLGQVGLTHGMTHLGEIELARTLVGV